MSRKTRVVVFVLVFEVLLTGLWFYLASYGAANPGSVTGEFQARVGQVLGMAMGGLLGIGIALYFAVAARERRERG